MNWFSNHMPLIEKEISTDKMANMPDRQSLIR